INGYDGLALGKIHSGRNGNLVTKVPGKADVFNAWILLRSGDNRRQTPVSTSIIDHNDLVVLRNGRSHADDPTEKLIEDEFFVKDGNYDGKVNGRLRIHSSSKFRKLPQVFFKAPIFPPYPQTLWPSLNFPGRFRSPCHFGFWPPQISFGL